MITSHGHFQRTATHFLRIGGAGVSPVLIGWRGRLTCDWSVVPMVHLSRDESTKFSLYQSDDSGSARLWSIRDEMIVACVGQRIMVEDYGSAGLDTPVRVYCSNLENPKGARHSGAMVKPPKSGRPGRPDEAPTSNWGSSNSPGTTQADT